MKTYQALIILLAALFASYVILQTFAMGDKQQTPAQDPADKAGISDDVQALENNAQSLKSDAQSTLADVQYIEMWLNPNIDLSSGNKADIWSRINTVNSNARDYQQRLDGMNRDMARISGRLGEMDQSDPDVAVQINRVGRVKDNLLEIQGIINDIYSINSRLNLGLLETIASPTTTPTPLPTPLPTPTLTPTPAPFAFILNTSI